jgi:hypothetical protein
LFGQSLQLQIMESTYERIDRCILGFFNDTIQPASYSQADYEKFQHDLQESYSAVRKSVIRFVFSADDHRKVEYRIQQFQRQLVHLADHIEAFLLAKKSTKTESQPYKNACHLAIRQVEEMLTFLEQNFPHFLNMNEKIPAGYKRLLQREMKQRVKQVKAILVTLTLDPEYLELIMQPAEELLQANTIKSFSYHDIWYLKRMYEELIQTFQMPRPQNRFSKMTEFLVSINFNSPFFLQYYTKCIAISVADAGSLHAQIEKLSWWQKEIAHLYQSVSTPFKPQIPGSKESLETWVRDEMKHLEKVHQLALIIPSQQEIFTPAAAVFSTSFNVPELACFFSRSRSYKT